MAESGELHRLLDDVVGRVDGVVKSQRPDLSIKQVGVIESVGEGTAQVSGLAGARLEELVEFPGNRFGMVFDVDEYETGIVMLDESESISAGSEVRRTGRILEVPVGDELIGRVTDALARPLDDKGPLRASLRRPVEVPAPGIMDREPVNVPLQTGIKAIDAMIPIGRGQRELILGDRQTGKTAIAVDTIINQKDQDVICIYCAIGKRGSAVAKVIDDLRKHGAMDYSVVIVTTADEPPGLQFVAPYAATSVGEYFMEQGRDALVVYDDLTYHARAYREVSLLLRRPPGREAFPGDIFYVHSRLLERSTHLKDDLGGGSLTALPIVETEEQNISGYIPTNLISITDGQIYLSPNLFQKGFLPAVDIGTSVSRVGGKTQLKAYRSVVGSLKLAYSQYEELEAFARFGTRLDEETKQKLERGRRVREILKQPQYETMPVAEQITVMMAVNEGVMDDVPTAKVTQAEKAVRQRLSDESPDLIRTIEQGQEPSESEKQTILDLARRAVRSLRGDDNGANG